MATETWVVCNALCRACVTHRFVVRTNYVNISFCISFIYQGTKGAGYQFDFLLFLCTLMTSWIYDLIWTNVNNKLKYASKSAYRYGCYVSYDITGGNYEVALQSHFLRTIYPSALSLDTQVTQEWRSRKPQKGNGLIDSIAYSSRICNGGCTASALSKYKFYQPSIDRASLAHVQRSWFSYLLFICPPCPSNRINIDPIGEYWYAYRFLWDPVSWISQWIAPCWRCTYVPHTCFVRRCLLVFLLLRPPALLPQG